MEDIPESDKIFEECLKDNFNKHKKYSIDFKLKVLKLIELKASKHKISDKLGIDRKIIREWSDNKNSLLKVANKETSFRCNRKTGIKSYFSDFEELEIIKWISEKCKELKPISTKSLVSFAGIIKPEFKKST